MNLRSRFYLVSFLVAGFLTFVLFTAPAVETLNLKGRDFFFQLRNALVPSQVSSDGVLLVQIDDETLGRLHDAWPYPRSVYTEVLERLKPFRPKAIGFDLIFSGSDPNTDDAFSTSIANTDNVVLAAHLDRSGAVGPSELLSSDAWKIGIVDKPKDEDGVIRRAYRWHSKAGQDYPSWEGALMYHTEGTYSLLNRSDFVIDYRFHLEDMPHISFWRVLEGSVLSKEINGKIILIGPTAEIFHDFHMTSLGRMSGVVMNANALLTLRNNRFFKILPPHLNVTMCVLLLWLGLLVGLFYPFILGGLFLSVAISSCLLLSFVLFNSYALLDLWAISTTVLIVFLVTKILKSFYFFLWNQKLNVMKEQNSNSPFLKSDYLFGKIGYELTTLQLYAYKKKFFSMIALNVRDAGAVTFLAGSVRKDELVCDWKEHQFAILLPNTKAEDAELFALKIRRALKECKAVVVTARAGKVPSRGRFLQEAETKLSA